MHLFKSLLLAATCLCCAHAQAFCFAQAGERYHINPLLLEAIAIHESSLRPGAVNDNGPRLGKIMA